MNDQGKAVSIAPARRRWLPRFGLRMLLILVAIFGAGFGYLGHLYRRVAHQRYIVAKIQEAGGTVYYEDKFDIEQHLDHLTATTFPPVSGTTRSANQLFQAGEFFGRNLIRSMLGSDASTSVRSVDFRQSSYPTEPFDPRLLLELRRLRILSAVDHQINDDWLNYIAQIPELRALELTGNAGSRVTGTGLAKLESAKCLVSLSLHGEWVRDETIAGIAKLKQLKQLSIISPNVTSAIFATLGELTELQDLSIANAVSIDDQGTEPLNKLRELRDLFVFNTPISDYTCAQLTELTQLKSLALVNTHVGDAGMKSLGTLSNLRHLALGDTKVGDPGLNSISRLPDLRVLSLSGTQVTDQGMAALSRMTPLERLCLSPTAVTDEGLLQLRTLANLKEILIGPQVTKRAAEVLHESLQQCRIACDNESGGFVIEPDGQ